MKLRKLNNGYYSLYDSDGDIVASNNPDTPCSKKLSKENCDEIFGVINVEKLADEYIVIKPKHREHEHNLAVSAYIEGFNKAMELNKDKLFTVEDIMKAFEAGYETLESEKTYNEHYDILIQLLQQPIEIEVEIVTEPMNIDEIREQGKGFLNDNTNKPKLNEDGCLILTKKK